MHRHSYFDLLLPTDSELEPQLGIPVLHRETLHQWPLSCVERVTLANGATRICKSMSGPLVEPAFYRAVTSDLLPGCQVLHDDGRYATLLLDDLRWPRADQLELTPAAARRLADDVTRQIQALPRPLPVFMDLSSAEKWVAIVDALCARLGALIAAGDVGALEPGDVARLQHTAMAPRLLAVLGEETGLIHADLTAENVFVMDDTVKVIDWQFPRLGPRSLDVATFLHSRGIEPAGFVDGAAVALLHLLHIEWFVQCATRWFPAGRAEYARQIAQKLSQAEQYV